MSSWYLYLSFTCLRQALGDKRKGGTELTNSFIKFIGRPIGCPLYDRATPELEIRDYKRLYPGGKCDLNYWPKRAVESKEKSVFSPKFFPLFDKNVGLSFYGDMERVLASISCHIHRDIRAAVNARLWRDIHRSESLNIIKSCPLPSPVQKHMHTLHTAASTHSVSSWEVHG